MRQGNTRPSTSEDVNRNSGSFGSSAKTGVASMRALQEKKTVYQNESILFLQRLKQYMKMIFAMAEHKTTNALQEGRSSSHTKRSAKLDSRIHEVFRKEIWRYSQLMLFSRETDPFEWEEMMRLYEQAVKKSYQEEFRDNVIAWKRVAKKPFGDEQDMLFTAQEKEHESIASTARKLTVKRGKTLRTTPSETIRSYPGEKSKDRQIYAYETFSGALDEMTPLVFTEQNFIVEFFHVSSLENADFSEAVATPPDARKEPDLTQRKLFDPDRNMAKKVVQMMDGIYSTWPADLQSLIDWAIKADLL